ncbi:MAG: LysR family transcriptional regulator [Devosia sp.]|uniref:LysR family transcriptional regulator n=1 Tax=Devosia sp. TaxID=1871048 RepID=UPI001A62637F|nr:LysR family transcriptional regulator [Devosia sp.]MBL8600275.1 LysR family transcriptional regulator [Devosia sp.]
MDLRHIDYIRVIAELGKLSAAATRLGVAQPTLSKILSRVEDEFGTKLFNRSPHGVTPTPFGSAFLERSAVMERELRDLHAVSDLLASGDRGQVRIGAEQSWLFSYFPTILSRLYLKRPGLVVTVESGTTQDLSRLLADGKLDVCCQTFDDPPISVFSYEVLYKDSVAIVGRRGHPLSIESDLPAILSSDWIVANPEGSNTGYSWLVQIAHQNGLPPPRIAVRTQEYHLILKILRTTNLLAAMPYSIARASAKELSLIRLTSPPRERSTGLMWRPDRPTTPAMKIFMEVTREVNSEYHASENGVTAPVI